MMQKFPLDHEPSKKRAHVSPTTISSFFSIISKFKWDDVTQMGFVDDLMLFVVKGCYLWRLLIPFGSKGCHIQAMSMGCFPIQENICWRYFARFGWKTMVLHMCNMH